MTIQFTVGSQGSPQVGQTEFVSDDLKWVFIESIEVNKISENQLCPNPDFSHNYVEGKIKRNNPFILGDKVIIKLR